MGWTGNLNTLGAPLCVGLTLATSSIASESGSDPRTAEVRTTTISAEDLELLEDLDLLEELDLLREWDPDEDLPIPAAAPGEPR